MKDYVAEFQSKIAEIDADCQTINIINAGIMNHGKSSLFNSLMNQEIFEAQDVRTTKVNKSMNWRTNVYLIDTPGLAAEESDDVVAYDAYRRANMIIFVHNIKVGELHDKELAAINQIKKLFNNDKFFCQHFCLVLTFKESDSEENVAAIQKKTLRDIQKHCDISEFPTFTVSNSRYKKGFNENKRNLVNKSGIPELRNYLISRFYDWNNENEYFRAMRIANAKEEFIHNLEQERENLQHNINSKIHNIESRQQNFLYKVEAALTQREEDKSSYDQAQSQLRSMKERLSDLKAQWNREKY